MELQNTSPFLFHHYPTNASYYEEEITEPFQFPYFFRLICYFLYNLVLICGLLGNTLVFYTIHFTHPKMKTVQNYFLGNLALGDLLILTLCVPTGYIDVLWQYWPFGELACRILTPAKAMGVFVSSYTLIALAIDRYLAILYPLNPGLTRRQAKWILGSIWLAAVLTATPVAVYSHVEYHLATGLPRCGEYGWDSFTEEFSYSLLLLLLQYVFPVCVLIFTYARISLVVWGRQSQRDSLAQQPSNGKRKTVILSLSVVLGYTLAWLPYNIVYMVYKHGPDWIVDLEPLPYIYISCHFLAMSHTTFNPVIYFWINGRFRKAFVQVFCYKCPALAECFGVPPQTVNVTSWRDTSINTERRRISSLLVGGGSARNGCG